LIEALEEPAPAGSSSAHVESTGHVWAEGPDRFAPYSQLFSRLKPSKETD
jgi:hypothetical protein